MSAMPAYKPRRPLTADMFEQLITSGFFDEDDRVELIDGEMVDMSPIGGAHTMCVNRLTLLFTPALMKRAITQVQGPILVCEESRPQPDLALLRPSESFYDDRVAPVADVLLTIEVADSSFAYDRWTKMPLYAAAGVPETWVVNLKGKVIVVGTEPSSQGYRRVAEVKAGDMLAPRMFPDMTLAVSEILGKSRS